MKFNILINAFIFIYNDCELIGSIEIKFLPPLGQREYFMYT